MLMSNFSDSSFEAGIDEAGRGSLAGPVTAAAVILPKNYRNDALNDSKKLSEKKRNLLADEIKRRSMAWSIGISDVNEIDSINILQASLLAMQRAIENLDIMPQLILVDGVHAPDIDIPTKTIIKGDQIKKSIMAASIIAKVSRDNYMKNLDDKFPNYGFKQHKGYPTKFHLEALKLYGITKEHRLSFKPVSIINESNR